MSGEQDKSRFGPAVRRFMEVNNIPEPPPMTQVERAEWEATLDRVDADVRRRYGPSEWAA
jgi:hypothetical protein